MASSTATHPDDYIRSLPADRGNVIQQLRDQFNRHLPKGFKEEMSYGMIGYVVPHNLYPPGYHADPKLPLPFINIAAQKNHFAVYHMGLYRHKGLMNWFTEAFNKQSKVKLDMGKSCIRFKKATDVPYPLFGELAGKMTVKQWIELYESGLAG
jgi:uncharacterized protein YdhG (YjbR/CyaY superfamily)